jgi:hypothetical protein
LKLFSGKVFLPEIVSGLIGVLKFAIVLMTQEDRASSYTNMNRDIDFRSAYRMAVEYS